MNVIKKVVLKTMLLDSPEMTFLNDNARHDFEMIEHENVHCHCSSLLVFARDWARLMERQVQHGGKLDQETIAKCEEVASADIADDSLCPSWAKYLLEDYWIYGKVLRNHE